MLSTTLVKKSTKKKEEVIDQEPTKSEHIEAVKASTDVLLDQIDQILAEVGEELKAKQAEEDATKPFTLAMAMREGSSVTDQALGSWTTPQGQTCAFSAALLAIKARGLA